MKSQKKEIIEILKYMNKETFLLFLQLIEKDKDWSNYDQFEKHMRVGIYSESNALQFLENELEQLQQFKPENQELLVLYGLEKFDLFDEKEGYYFEHYINSISDHQKKIELIKNEVDKLRKSKKDKEPLELSEFLHDEQFRYKLPAIADKIKTYDGKKMATAIYALLEMGVLVHGNKELKKLAITINPNLTTTDIGSIRNYLNPNESSKILDDGEIESFKIWVSSL